MSNTDVKTDAIIVLTTTDSRELAEQIAHRLVAKRLAACVQVDGPIHSVYRWHEAVEEAAEWRCAIKTTAAAYDQVEQAIRKWHTYDEPEIVVLAIAGGSATYLQWLRQQVGGFRD